MPHIYDTREKYAAFVEQQTKLLWDVYEEITTTKALPQVEDAPPRLSFAEEVGTMTPEEVDRYLNDWAQNMPEDIFEALVARRSKQLREAWHAADKALDDYYTQLGNDPKAGTEADHERFRELRATRQAAWAAWNNR